MAPAALGATILLAARALSSVNSTPSTCLQPSPDRSGARKPPPRLGKRYLRAACGQSARVCRVHSPSNTHAMRSAQRPCRLRRRRGGAELPRQPHVAAPPITPFLCRHGDHTPQRCPGGPGRPVLRNRGACRHVSTGLLLQFMGHSPAPAFGAFARALPPAAANPQ